MASAFESIATATPSAGTSTVSFTSISSNYDHYFITMYYRANSGSGNSNVHIRLNNTAGSSYTQIRSLSNGGISYSGNPDINEFDIGDITDTNYASSQVWVFGTQTNRWKQMWAQGSDVSTGGRGKWNYGAFMNTGTINRVDLFIGDSKTFGGNTVIALYGVKGA